MKEMILQLLRSMIPTDGDYRITYRTTEAETGRAISIRIQDPKLIGEHIAPQLVAEILVHIPKR